MPGIVDFPEVVRDALDHYGDLFASDRQRRHFAEYLTGPFVAERKTVLGINGEFAQTTDQSCLNRLLTEARWEVLALNERRLERLQEDPATRDSDHGIIPIDNTLIDRDGMLIPDAGWYWDHGEERHKIARDYQFINDVCTGGKHYPLEFRLSRKEEDCKALGEPFRNHTALCCELIDGVCERHIPGDFTRDCYFTNAEILNHIHGRKRVRYLEQPVRLRDYEGAVRQIAVTGMGREEPTLFLTNHFEAKPRELIMNYARRNRIEDGLGTSVDFFHLDCLSSEVRLNVDLDVALTVIAHGCYRWLAGRLKGFDKAKPKQLYRKFVETGGAIEVATDRTLRVRFDRRSHNPILREAVLDGDCPPIPWLSGYRVEFHYR